MSKQRNGLLQTSVHVCCAVLELFRREHKFVKFRSFRFKSKQPNATMPHRDKSMSSTMSASMNASRRRRSGRRTGTPATATSRRARREANCKDMRATFPWLYFCCLYFLAAEADSNTPHTIIAQWCACQAVSSQGSSPSLTLPWIGEKRRTCRGKRGEGQRAALAIPHRVHCLHVCQLYNVGHTLCRQRVHNQRPGTTHDIKHTATTPWYLTRLLCCGCFYADTGCSGTCSRRN